MPRTRTQTKSAEAGETTQTSDNELDCNDEEEGPRFAMLWTIHQVERSSVTGPPLPAYLWNISIIRDLAAARLDDLPHPIEAVILRESQALLFFGDGLFPQEATLVESRLTTSTEWATKPVLAVATRMPMQQALRKAKAAEAAPKQRKGRSRKRSRSPLNTNRSNAGSTLARRMERPLHRSARLREAKRGTLRRRETIRSNPARRGLSSPGGGDSSPPPSGSDSDWMSSSREDRSELDYSTDRSSSYWAATRRTNRRNPRGKVQIPDFSASQESTAVTYTQWRKAVQMALYQGHHERDVLMAIHASLKGFPGDLVRILPLNTPLMVVLDHLDDHYGEVRSADLLLQQLYALSQKVDESATEFAIRVGRSVHAVQEVAPTSMTAAAAANLCKHRFYEGLLPDLRKALTFLMHEDDVTLSDLLAEARNLESRNRLRKQAESRKPAAPAASAADATRTAAQPQTAGLLNTKPASWTAANTRKLKGTRSGPLPQRWQARIAQANDLLDSKLEQLQLEDPDGPPEDAAEEGEADEESLRQAFVTGMVAGAQDPNMVLVCWACDEPGHLKRDCPKKGQGLKAQGNARQGGGGRQARPPHPAKEEKLAAPSDKDPKNQ